mmetsp:Transcript_13782/g.32670  ORF Transcript_13782/g.32670 Transcript_13782/m.32670 type:complete len:295 (-) Transcript_13782:1081-1965(-)
MVASAAGALGAAPSHGRSVCGGAIGTGSGAFESGAPKATVAPAGPAGCAGPVPLLARARSMRAFGVGCLRRSRTPKPGRPSLRPTRRARPIWASESTPSASNSSPRSNPALGGAEEEGFDEDSAWPPRSRSAVASQASKTCTAASPDRPPEAALEPAPKSEAARDATATRTAGAPLLTPSTPPSPLFLSPRLSPPLSPPVPLTIPPRPRRLSRSPEAAAWRATRPRARGRADGKGCHSVRRTTASPRPAPLASAPISEATARLAVTTTSACAGPPPPPAASIAPPSALFVSSPP